MYSNDPCRDIPFFLSTGSESGGMHITPPVLIFAFRCAFLFDILSSEGSFSTGDNTEKFLDTEIESKIIIRLEDIKDNKAKVFFES